MTRIHARRGARLGSALLVAGLVAVALSHPLEAQGAGELASVTVFPGGVDFRPNVDYSRAFLTVSGSDKVFQRVIEAGEDLSIGFFDPEGELLPEGLYTWRLVFQASAETARELRIAASHNGGTAPEPWSALSGSFAIRGGAVITPDSIEPEPVRLTLASGLSADSTYPGFAPPLTDARLPPEDNDDAVGFRKNVEREAQAAGAKSARSAFMAGVRMTAGSNDHRSDATALSLGRSLEQPVMVGTQQPTQTRSSPVGQRTRSADGAHGRPREND